MPLKTFHNLKSSQKAEIIRVSYEEFVFNSYKNASVTNIVKRLNIAKGSFYRYFKSKEDLYTFLTKNAYYLRIQQLGVLQEETSIDFFEILRENFRNKIIFDIQHPLESTFLFNLFLEKETREVEKLYKDTKGEILNLTKKLIIQFQESGRLNNNINPDVAAHFIFQSQMGIYDYLAFKMGVDFKENIKKGNKVFDLPETEIMKIVDDTIVLLKSGLKIP